MKFIFILLIFITFLFSSGCKSKKEEQIVLDSKDLESQMTEAYTANPNRDTVDALAKQFGKSVRSIIAKLSREGVYVAQPKVTKTGEPVVRKAELLRGGCSEEEATNLNGRSLLTLATGISSGFACVLFPEGTSHDLSHMLRFRTGPMRTVLAAAAIAKANGDKCPVLQPVGLHFRVRHHYRTDMWVEFGDPHYLPEEKIPEDLIEAVKQLQWVEPPQELVRSLRDNLRPHLHPLTPNVSSWDEHGGMHLIAQVQSRMENKPLRTWREEVLAAREVRDRYQTELEHVDSKPVKIEHPTLNQGMELHKKLEERNLDGRDLNKDATGLRGGNPLRLVDASIRTAIMAALLPVFLVSLSLQMSLGRFLGDRTDEGVDARTTYQFLAAMFGSVLMWPFISLATTGALWWFESELETILSFEWTQMFGESSSMVATAILTVYLCTFPTYWLTGRIFGFWWDSYVDTKKAFRRLTSSSTYKSELEEKLTNLRKSLAREKR